MSWNENDLLFGAIQQAAHFRRRAKIKRLHERRLRQQSYLERVQTENAIEELDGLLDAV